MDFACAYVAFKEGWKNKEKQFKRKIGCDIQKGSRSDTNSKQKQSPKNFCTKDMHNGQYLVSAFMYFHTPNKIKIWKEKYKVQEHMAVKKECVFVDWIATI